MKRWVFLFTLMLLTPFRAEALTHAAVFWAPSYSIPWPGENTGGASTTGFGGTASFRMASWVDFESGLIYQTMTLNSYVSDHLTVPYGFRIAFTRWLSISFGGYLAVQFNALPPQINPFDYGARATVGLELPFDRRIALFVDAGTEIGVHNLSMTSGSFRLNQGFILIGLRFDFRPVGYPKLSF